MANAAAQDIVAVHLIITAGQAQLFSQPPMFAKVESSGGGNTVVNTLDGRRVTIPVIGTHSCLDIITDDTGTDSEKARLLRAYVKRVVNAIQPSAEFGGRCIAVYRRTPDGAAALSGSIVALVETENGTYYEDLSSSFEVIDGR